MMYGILLFILMFNFSVRVDTRCFSSRIKYFNIRALKYVQRKTVIRNAYYYCEILKSIKRASPRL